MEEMRDNQEESERVKVRLEKQIEALKQENQKLKPGISDKKKQ